MFWIKCPIFSWVPPNITRQEKIELGRYFESRGCLRETGMFVIKNFFPASDREAFKQLLSKKNEWIPMLLVIGGLIIGAFFSEYPLCILFLLVFAKVIQLMPHYWLNLMVDSWDFFLWTRECIAASKEPLPPPIPNPPQT